MTTDRTYRRVIFPPADECALGPVTIYAGDGVTKLGVLSVEALRKRPPATSQAAAIEPHRAGFVIPTVDRRKKPKVEND